MQINLSFERLGKIGRWFLWQELHQTLPLLLIVYFLWEISEVLHLLLYKLYGL